MPSNSFRIGVASVAVAKDDSTVLPSLATLSYTVSATVPTDLRLNDIKNPLPTASAMQVMIGLVGRDTTNGGYTVGICSPGSGVLATLTAGSGILINIPNATLVGLSGISKATCMAIFLKIGAGDFQLAEFAYIDTANDFNHMIVAKPMLDAPAFTALVLQAATADSVLGDRAPKGFIFESYSPTTGGVTVNREVATVKVDPDTGTSIDFPTARTASISFQLLSNDILDIVLGNAGNFVTYTSNGKIVTEAQMSLNTAIAKITGNKPIRLVMPPDNFGIQETRLYLGQLTQNTVTNAEAWKKDAPTPVSYTFAPASLDKLITSQHTEIIYKIR